MFDILSKILSELNWILVPPLKYDQIFDASELKRSNMALRIFCHNEALAFGFNLIWSHGIAVGLHFFLVIRLSTVICQKYREQTF